MSIGDVKSNARGAGARFNDGKSEYHQFPLEAIEGAVRVLMYGAKKYAPGNYLKGMRWTVVFDSLVRHLAKWQRGEELDPESGLPHLDHAMCNLMFLSIYRDVYPEGDDRWTTMKIGGVSPALSKQRAHQSVSATGKSGGVVSTGSRIAKRGSKGKAKSRKAAASVITAIGRRAKK